jgi:ligand-binding sensor domain-containing protein
MRRIIFSTIIFSLCFMPCLSQTGNSFLTHYSPADERIDYRSVGMVQDNRGLIYFTNKKGVLEFDGKNWQLISTPGAVYTLSLLNNEVYVGGSFGFGKVATTKGTQQTYQSLVTAQHIFSSVVANGKIYACNETSLYILSADKIEKEIKAEAKDAYTGLLEVHQNIFVKSQLKSLSQLINDQLGSPIVTMPTESEIIFAVQSNKNNDVVVGTERGKIFAIKEKSQPLELKLFDANYINQNKLVSAAWVNESLLAVGTLLGGVVLVNPTTGATQDILDYNHGLPDNEVFAMLTDKNEGVWVAHQYGFTRIAPSIPFKSYNHYTGLAGNLLCVKSINGSVYVGTTLGLYKLVKEESYQVITTTTQALEKNAEENTKRGLFGFFRKRSKQSISPTPNKQSTASTVVRVTQPPSYSYKRVDGIVGKVTQLIDINGKLIACGLSGVFEIENQRAKPIVLEPVHSVFFSPSLQQLFVSTYNEELKSYLPSASWKETHLLDTLNDYVSYAFEDNLQNIWLCGRSTIYKVETVDGAITDVAKIDIDNSSLDEMVGVAYGSEVYVATSGEFKRYNRNNSFVKYDSLPGPHRYFASAGYFWFNDGSQWRTVDKRLQSLKLQWLGLFPNLRYLSPDEKGESLWVITANNELFKFSGSGPLADEQHYPLLLRGVRGQEINLLPDKKMVMNQSENVLSFEFIQPDYVSRYVMQYRYQVDGLTNGWTAWSSGNYVANFPFLPAGSYKLSMQSRDLLGNESKVEVINFEVLPPYWKRWWFYALEFAFFAILMILSVRLSSANTKYHYVSEILSLLTVIIFIQFVSTGINSVFTFDSSPVIQFFIQVFIALLVFPLENYFRKFMRAAAEGKLQPKFKIKQN